VNLGDTAIELPGDPEVLLSSEPLAAGKLPSDATAWLKA